MHRPKKSPYKIRPTLCFLNLMKNGFCVGEAVFVFSERFFSPYLETERKNRGKIELIWPSPSSGSRQASRPESLGEESEVWVQVWTLLLLSSSTCLGLSFLTCKQGVGLDQETVSSSKRTFCIMGQVTTQPELPGALVPWPHFPFLAGIWSRGNGYRA